MNHDEYVRLLEASMPIDQEVEYTGPQSEIRKWDGNEPLPTFTTDSKELDLMVEKILKKDQDGTDIEDPKRDDSGPSELKESDDCPDCEKAAMELLKEMGLSPLDLLEMEGEEAKAAEEIKDEVLGGDGDTAEGEGNTNIEINFDLNESSVLEQLIAEMSLLEDQDGEILDEFADMIETTE